MLDPYKSAINDKSSTAMGKTYFGLAMADSMFPSESVLTRKGLTLEELKDLLAGDVEVCLNPSHQTTISAMESKFGIEVAIPATAPVVKLQSGDSLVLFSVRGLPRLDASRHEYTEEEIAQASFSFGIWTVA